MLKLSCVLAGLPIVLGFLLAAPSGAIPVTIGFSAVLGPVDDPDGLLSVVAGSTITGSHDPPKG
jgi:hypothetical protein